MSNEISLSLSVANTAFKLNKSESYRGDHTLQRRQVLTQLIGTAEESFTVNADLTTVGFLFIRNTDATNYVQMGFSTTVYGIRMKAGDPTFVMRLDSTSVTLYLKANTASCAVDIELWAA